MCVLENYHNCHTHHTGDNIVSNRAGHVVATLSKRFYFARALLIQPRIPPHQKTIANAFTFCQMFAHESNLNNDNVETAIVHGLGIFIAMLRTQLKVM